MAEAFKAGNTVQLKSGGPKMTVRAVTGQGQNVLCVWFVRSKKQEARFKADELKLTN